MDKVFTFTDNTSVSNKTFDGDVYIGPNAVVTLSNVKVNGNVYVLGGLNLAGVKGESLYARTMTFSSGTTCSNGQIRVSGINDCTSMAWVYTANKFKRQGPGL